MTLMRKSSDLFRRRQLQFSPTSIFSLAVAVSFLVVVIIMANDRRVAGDVDVPTAASAPRRLQIGVKKRVENCPTKTKKGDLLHIHYTGSLLSDGSVFDSSYDRGEPLTFTLGAGQVIKGWDQGHLGMCEGEKRKLVIPPELGYGSSGAPPKIPANAVLIFETELVKIERRGGGGEL